MDSIKQRNRRPEGQLAVLSLVATFLVSAIFISHDVYTSMMMLESLSYSPPTIGNSFDISGRPNSDSKATLLRHDSVLHNLSLVMMGDSITRYQYLSLLHYVHFGEWEPRNATPTIVCEKQFSNWMHFYNYTNSMFDGKETCDCFRADDNGNHFVPEQVYENRFYQSDDISISFFCKFGSVPFHGHTSASDIRKASMQDAFVPAVWEEYSWDGLLSNYIAQIQPRPQIVLINAGLWPKHGLDDEAVFINIRKALDDLGMVGIYKTTTRRQGQGEGIADHDVLGCNHLHYCFNMSWTGSIQSSEYWDVMHYNSNVNRQMNERFLELLKDIRNRRHE